MSLETFTSLGNFVFTDDNWNQSAADGAFSIAFWWYTTSATSHNDRLGACGDFGSDWIMEYRDSGADTQTVGFVRAYDGTNLSLTMANSTFPDDQWHFTVFVDNGVGNVPKCFNGSETTVAAEAGYKTQTAGTTAVTNPPSTSNLPLIIGGRDDSSTNAGIKWRLAYVGMFNAALTLAEAKALQYNPWALPDKCSLACFPGHAGAGAGQMDHIGGYTADTINGTMTYHPSGPLGIGTFPQIGGWHSGMLSAAAGGQPTMRRWGGVSNMNLVRPSIGRSW